MDTIPLPTRKDRKGSQIIRASRKQSEILLNLFAHNPVASPESVKSVSEETGLPTKWINSWFVRQRRKARDATTTAQGAMSTYAIDKFKAEYQDPILLDARDEGLTRRDKLPVKRKADSGRTKKIKTEHEDNENASPHVMPLFPQSPKPPPLPPASGGARDVDPALLPSKFILREMIPRVWIPPGSHRPPTLGSTTSNLNSTTHATQNQCLSHSSAYTTPQTRISDVRTILRPASHNNTPPTSRSRQLTHIPIRAQNGISNALHYPLDPDPHRSLPGRWHHHQQQPRPHQASHFGPGRTAGRKLQANVDAPLSAPSVFTTGLASSSHPVVYPNPTPMNDENWLSGLGTAFVTGPTPEVASVMALPALPPPLPPQQIYCSLTDPSTTPLKYLTVLEPLERCVGTNGVHAALQQDVLFDRLLDENLARIDPFQAAMGLVFLSRLGLEWEY